MFFQAHFGKWRTLLTIRIFKWNGFYSTWLYFNLVKLSDQWPSVEDTGILQYGFHCISSSQQSLVVSHFYMHNKIFIGCWSSITVMFLWFSCFFFLKIFLCTCHQMRFYCIALSVCPPPGLLSTDTLFLPYSVHNYCRFIEIIDGGYCRWRLYLIPFVWFVSYCPWFIPAAIEWPQILSSLFNILQQVNFFFNFCVGFEQRYL